MLPSLGTDTLFCQRLALATSSIVWDVDYRGTTPLASSTPENDPSSTKPLALL